MSCELWLPRPSGLGLRFRVLGSKLLKGGYIGDYVGDTIVFLRGKLGGKTMAHMFLVILHKQRPLALGRDLGWAIPSSYPGRSDG